MRRLGCLAALALLSACSMTSPGQSPAPQDTPSPTDSRFVTAPPLPSATAPSGTPVTLPESRLAAIRSDLTGRGVDVAGLSVVSAESVTFNDSSLGCPKPGVQYTQAQVPGLRVVVTAAGASYDYRFGRGDNPVLCEQPAPGATSTTR